MATRSAMAHPRPARRLAVHEGDDARIRTLLATLTAAADTAALLYLRERLYAPE
ncbi:hypothetical protein OTB20_40405 [Streptomyces sp. H27-H1]|uniref:hypothetical protein n=1 Tax=Streptomyces sp. H27-H1 TaxID=2996461 RepID=UPI00226E6E53|nr:hypothetical protein [Streptomyces sp. H27-H1]MCY0932309.1 hypothetical protein [Streptomyces sp. H27-H1]